MKKTFVTLVGILVVILVIFLNGRESKNETLKIGVILPLTGPAAVWGESIKNGIILAQKDLENQNIKVDLIYEDGEASPSKSVSAFNKLVNVDKVDVVLSALSGPTVPLVDLAEEKSVPLIGIGLANEEFASSSKYSYRVYSKNSDYAEKIISYVENNNYKKVGILIRADEYGESLSKIIRPQLEKKEIFVFEEKILPTDTDYRTQIQKLKSEEVETIIFTGITPQELSNFISQKQSLFKESDLFVAGLQLSISSVRKELGSSIEGVQTFFFPEAINNQEFDKKYFELFKQEPIFAANFGYDALIFTALPIKNKYNYGSIQEGLQKVVNNLVEMDGVSGKIIINKEGEVNTKLSVAKIKEGELLFIE